MDDETQDRRVNKNNLSLPHNLAQVRTFCVNVVAPSIGNQITPPPRISSLGVDDSTKSAIRATWGSE
ncbi:unnamed protein product [Tuber melanosporum]|uniref:(Perigord truffle) hypothetical protein n=1 Tax=Tuber melanosporum (strain Mel28) TaxID=656061 RepID=D5G661_TUBMM|nr:uncharacterized protein GSTUM_00001785001 [Tuber melanosporum]CAZ80004.1 unnamed protein product [Tuber melanosporum]